MDHVMKYLSGFTNVSKVYKPVHHKVELNLIDLEPDVEYDKWEMPKW